MSGAISPDLCLHACPCGYVCMHMHVTDNLMFHDSGLSGAATGKRENKAGNYKESWIGAATGIGQDEGRVERWSCQSISLWRKYNIAQNS